MNETCPSASAASASSTAWNTPCADTLTLNDRLSLFSEWRGRAGNGQAGLYHLMTVSVAVLLNLTTLHLANSAFILWPDRHVLL